MSIYKGWGRIINVSSINGLIAHMHAAAYTASKHALNGFTKVCLELSRNFSINYDNYENNIRLILMIMIILYSRATLLVGIKLLLYSVSYVKLFLS